MFLGTLTVYIYLPPLWLKPYVPVMIEAAENKYLVTQQEISIKPSKKPEIKPTASHYQGILFTEKDEKDYLRSIFIYNGLEDKITQAEITINGESGWRWNARNSISAGLWAFTKDTWDENCADIGVYKDLNPFEQTRCAARLWKRGEMYRWDVYCFNYYDEKCIKLRGLYPK
jgi:hypothetical protein